MIRSYLRRAYRAALPLLHGRAHFKLFLKTSLGEVDLRLQQLASCSDYFSNYLRAIRIQAPFGDSMLVVAPHQDDEIIGCGAAMALQIRSRRPAVAVILSDGADEHEEVGMGRRELSKLRNEESRRAAAVLGAGEPLCFGHANLAAEQRIVAEELQETIAARRVDALFVPFFLDGHPDHRLASYIAAEALQTVRHDVRVFGYEVWNFCIANVALPIPDEVMEVKTRALSCFRFANAAVNYAWSAKGVNMYRSRVLEAGVCDYAECFFELPREEYIALVEKVRRVEVPLRAETAGE